MDTNSHDNASIGALCELMVLDHRYDKNGQAIVIPKVESLGDSKEKFAEYALVFRRIFSAKHELKETKVDINSRPILRVLSEIVKYYPSHPEKFDETLVVTSPFQILYHNWPQLIKYRDSTEDDEEKMHLNFLLDFMDHELGEDNKKAKRLVETGHISFSLLWSIFVPGELILDQEERGIYRLWRLVNTIYGEDDDGRYFSIGVTGTDYDGKISGRVKEWMRVDEDKVGKGAIITKLKLHPLRFVANQEKIIDKMTKRGQKFLALRGIFVRRYEGQLKMLRRPPMDFFSPKSSDYNGIFTSYNIQGRIIIDTSTFMEENGYYDPLLFDLEEEDTKEPEENSFKPPGHVVMAWKNIDPALCPPYVHGFCPSVKQWCRFYIDRISEAQWDKDCFEDLILPDAPKHVIRSLVTAHNYPDNGARDQQELKGKGLVVLLHGTPGTGKTLTAETVAEYTERALVVVSSGELGTTVSEIDINLSTFLQYASMWKAIVLIDEADVFLEARMTEVSNRLEQNSLVAVFLRHLEYFQGIVFLTSNRGRNFDPAIKSRIHLFLQFDPPTSKTRQTLWRLRLSKIDPEECDFDMEEALELVKDVDMNGRVISNAVNTMHTLAREEKVKMSLDHFKTFLQVWDCFEQVEQEAEGKGSIRKGGKEMRKDTIDEVCAHCGSHRMNSLIPGMLVRQGSLM
ncbi:P-loop containing nucleoside triphosphate hydrolase protein [Collybia nuda]|uniref:P-loop containing nucleoside triphosphate hydrolase protein n=1 Tax=Collybia nuda TaxID=64659 RepID=A0A9P6CFA0_9AGAR|nr:P-loop containing nucleoside triphosphate hydrolase protein [Collybia nuda]